VGLEHDLFPALVRIGSDQGYFGAGVLIDGDRVLTLAHVVNKAGNRKADERVPPDYPVIVDFAFCHEHPRFTNASVAIDGWLPIADDQTGDVAVLSLSESPPLDARPARWSREWRREDAVFVKGFSEANPDGVDAEAVLSTSDAKQWVQLNDRTPGQLIEGGFSGAPVYSLRLHRVVGLVVAHTAKRSVAFMLPADVLGEGLGIRYGDVLPVVETMRIRDAYQSTLIDDSSSSPPAIDSETHVREPDDDVASDTEDAIFSSGSMSFSGVDHLDPPLAEALPHETKLWYIVLTGGSLSSAATDIAREELTAALGMFGARRACADLDGHSTSDQVIESLHTWLSSQSLEDDSLLLYVAAEIYFHELEPYLVFESAGTGFDPDRALPLRALRDMIRDHPPAHLIVTLELGLSDANNQDGWGSENSWFRGASRHTYTRITGQNMSEWSAHFPRALRQGLLAGATENPGATAIDLCRYLPEGGHHDVQWTTRGRRPAMRTTVPVIIPNFLIQLTARRESSQIEAIGGFVDLDRVRDFVGRTSVFNHIVTWSRGGMPLVLVGRRGSGKSSILDVLAAASVPEFRAQIPPGVGPLPRIGWVDLALNVTGLSLRDVADVAARALSIDNSSVPEVVESIRDFEVPQVLLFDDIDRAVDPSDLVANLLEPVSQCPHVVTLLTAESELAVETYLRRMATPHFMDLDGAYDDPEARRTVLERLLRSSAEPPYDVAAGARRLRYRATTFRRARELALRDTAPR
jgi:Trypsin-like peptidase domain